MGDRILVGTEWAGALREALVARREGKADPAIDEQVGVFAVNLARWGIATRISKGKLPESYRRDEDFRMEVVCRIIPKMDTVDLSRNPREIISYLHRCAETTAKDLRMRDTAAKRTADILPIGCVDGTCDIYGNILTAAGVVVELNTGE